MSAHFTFKDLSGQKYISDEDQRGSKDDINVFKDETSDDGWPSYTTVRLMTTGKSDWDDDWMNGDDQCKQVAEGNGDLSFSMSGVSDGNFQYIDSDGKNYSKQDVHAPHTLKLDNIPLKKNSSITGIYLRHSKA